MPKRISRKAAKGRVEFVSYDAPRYARCLGTLTLRIDGRVTTFGYDQCDYMPFWKSGGRATLRPDGGADVTQGEWEFDPHPDFPERLAARRKDLMAAVNGNVPWGCCGGCL